MLEKSLAECQAVELVVNPAGLAILYHQGPLPNAFVWAQYDQENQSMQFVSDDGVVRDLGMPIHKPFSVPLNEANELFMIEVDDQKNYGPANIIKCVSLEGSH